MSITVRRANVILDVRPDEKKYYIEQGFSVIDKNGEVIESPMSNDTTELRALVDKLKAEVTRYKEKIQELTGSEPNTEEPESAESEDKPKKKAK